MEFHSTPFTLHQLLSETMKKVIYLLTIIIYCATLSAQNNDTYPAELLEGKDWYITFPSDVYSSIKCQGIKFVNGEQVSFMYVDNKREEVAIPYYLSQTPDIEFHWDKVGKTRKGKYLIILLKTDTVRCSSITELTSTSLVIQTTWNNQQITFTTKRPN